MDMPLEAEDVDKSALPLPKRLAAPNMSTRFVLVGLTLFQRSFSSPSAAQIKFFSPFS